MTDTPTDTPTNRTEDSPATDRDATTDRDAAANGDAPGREGRDLTGLLDRAALAALVLLALIAGLRFYLAASSTIDQWIVREYRSIFHATFNLALLLLAGYGISVQVRRLR